MTYDKTDEMLRERLLEIQPAERDLWPEIARKIRIEKPWPRYRKAMVTIGAVCAAALCLMGAGILRHWYVFDSSGAKTELNEGEGFPMGEVTALPVKDEEPAEIFFAYDWPDTAGNVPFGAEWPALNAFFDRAEPGVLLAGGHTVENGSVMQTETKGFFETDYEAFLKKAAGNALDLRFPEAAAVPEAYSQRQRFTASFYLTREDVRGAELLDQTAGEENAGWYGAASYALPEGITKQIGSYALEWFREDKKPVTVTASLAENTELFLTSADDDMTVQTRELTGFEKAVFWQYHNEYFDADDVRIVLWEKIDPLETADLYALFDGDPKALSEESGDPSAYKTARYICYEVSGVGLCEEELMKIVLSLQ